MKDMPNVWLAKLKSFDEVLTQIELCLDVLKDNAESSDFTDSKNIKQYSNDVIYMKQFFEKAESISRNNNVITP